MNPFLKWGGIALVVLIVLGVITALFSGGSGSSKQQPTAQVTPPAAPVTVGQPACPAGYTCTPNPTDGDKVASALDRLTQKLGGPGQLDVVVQQAPTTAQYRATAPARAPVAKPTGLASLAPGQGTGKDPRVSYTGERCQLSTGTLGFDGYLKATGERRCFSS